MNVGDGYATTGDQFGSADVKNAITYVENKKQDNFVTDFNSFSYFRKAHSEIESNAEFEIYNDAAGKLAMVNRILRLRLVPVLLLLAIHIPFLLKLLNRSNAYGLWSLLAVGLDIFLSLILLLVVSYIGWKLWHKKKELSDL